MHQVLGATVVAAIVAVGPLGVIGLHAGRLGGAALERLGRVRVKGVGTTHEVAHGKAGNPLAHLDDLACPLMAKRHGQRLIGASTTPQAVLGRAQVAG